MCCTRLAGNAGPPKSPKIRHLGIIAQLCRAISSQLRHVSTTGKKIVKQQYLPHVSSQYGELRPINGRDPFGSFSGDSVFGAVCDFFCLCMKYLWNCWTDLHQIHSEDVFGPSLGRVWRSRSKVKVARDKNGIFGPFGGLHAVYAW